MEVSFAARFGRFFGVRPGGDGNELTVDRLFAVSELGLDGHCVRSVAGGVPRRRVAAQSICRAIGANAPHHRDLRAHPPTDLVALTCRARGAMYEAEIYWGVTSVVANRFMDSFLLAFFMASARNSRLCAD